MKIVKTKEGEYIFSAPVITAGIMTPAGYTYDEKCLEVMKEESLAKIKEGKLLGELTYLPYFKDRDHVNRLQEFRTIKLKEVCTKFTNCFIEDGSLFVEGDIMDTPVGKQVKTLVDDDVEFGGFAFRGYAKTDKDGNIDHESLKVITFDLKAK